MPKILVSIQPMNLGKVIFFAYSDGSVEYRDRTTMLETYNDNDLNRIWHLSQIGFSYGEDDPCKSPTMSTVILFLMLSKVCKLLCHRVTPL